MKFKTLKWMGLALSITLTTAYAADSEYWKEFEAKGVPLMQHIQDLAAVSDSASASVRNRTKNALAYFFATGGKNGFRQEPATASEYDILVKALAVTTSLHYFGKKAPVLDLVKVRREYGLKTEDAMVQSHLVQAHAIIGYTLCTNRFLQVTLPLKEANPNLELSDIPGETLSGLATFGLKITTQCYAAPLKSLSTQWADSKLKSAFVDGFTLPVTKAVVSIVAPGFEKDIDQEDIDQIQALLNHASSAQAAPAGGIRQIRLGNGGVATRAGRGISLSMPGDSLMGNFSLHGGMSDEELLAALEQFGIAEVLYNDA